MANYSKNLKLIKSSYGQLSGKTIIEPPLRADVNDCGKLMVCKLSEDRLHLTTSEQNILNLFPTSHAHLQYLDFHNPR